MAAVTGGHLGIWRKVERHPGLGYIVTEIAKKYGSLKIVARESKFSKSRESSEKKWRYLPVSLETISRSRRII